MEFGNGFIFPYFILYFICLLFYNQSKGKFMLFKNQVNVLCTQNEPAVN